jgi:glycosyltransferase involved in cell wall biosynthesis
LKIFFCLKHFLPQQVAGTEIYVASLAKGLMAQGYEVAVIKPGYNIEEETVYHYEGIRVLQYPESPVSDSDLQTGKKYPPGIPAFQKILQREKPDLLHVHEISGSNGITMQHLRVAQQMPVRVFLTFHLTRYVCKRSTLLYKGRSECDGVIDIARCTTCLLQEKGLPGLTANMAAAMAMWMNRSKIDVSNIPLLNFPGYMEKHRNDLHQMAAIAEKTITLNHWFRKILLANDLPAQKITTVTQAVPGLQPIAVGEKKMHTASRLRLVFMGRICEIKGLKLLIGALNEINSNHISLDIYGKVTEENYYNECKALAVSNNNIAWKGVAAPSQVVELLQQYDVLVFPSIVEEMAPFTILESFAAGVPVLASGLYASREQIMHGKNGWLFSLEKKDGLRQQLQMLLDDPGKITAAASNILAVPVFDNVVSEHIKLYTERA